MTINTRWFRIDVLTSRRESCFGPYWRWRPAFIRPWDRARAVSWGKWHFVVTRRPNAAERRQMRSDYREAVRRIHSWAKEEGWVAHGS